MTKANRRSLHCGLLSSYKSSNAHGHDHVAILEIIGRIFRAHLTGGLSVLEFETNFTAGSDSPEKIDEIRRIEADHNGVEAVGRFDGVFRLSRFGRGRRYLHLVLLQPDLNRARTFIGKLRHPLD